MTLDSLCNELHLKKSQLKPESSRYFNIFSENHMYRYFKFPKKQVH